MDTQALNFAKRWEKEWQDHDVLPGVKLKLMYQNPELELINLLVKLPVGFQEAEHTHDAYHSEVILEGELHGHGHVLRAGDSLFAAPNVPHGPFSAPEGALLFVSFRGPSRLNVPTGATEAVPSEVDVLV